MKTNIFVLSFSILVLLGNITKAQDQVTFTNFTNTNGLPDEFVSGGVVVDQNNNKWFGTANGVAKFDDNVWTIYKTTDGIIDNYINCIEVDKDNNIWIGTDNGISKYNGSSWTNFTTTDGLIDNAVLFIKATKNGNIWFASYGGVSKLINGTFSNFTTDNGLPTNSIHSVSEDSTGNVWFGSLMGGAIKYDGTMFTAFTTDQNVPDNSVFTIGVDANNNKWIGTYYGIAVFNANDQHVTTYTKDNGLHDNYIRDIILDKENKIWIGEFADYNFEGGISFFSGTNWSFFTVADGLVNVQVRKMAVDQNDFIWIATGSGASKMEHHVGINSLEITSNCKIYPNPASCCIMVQPNDGEVVLSIVSMNGITLANEVVCVATKIDLTHWEKGVYFVKTQSKKSTSVSRLVID